ncbi:MAG: DUF2029 domain-containing protein [Deltaproteobacteria bacterium]|nr:DUF2029 domain-containing protein [Deltaproteobacteria bacterium]
MDGDPDTQGVLLRVLRRLTEPPLLTLVAGVQALGFVIVVVAYLASRVDPSTGIDPNTGDFLAFWTGGVMVHAGRGLELYDFHAQQVLQEQILVVGHGYFQPYLNPPGLAIAVAPAVPLGYVPTFVLFCLGMTAAFMAGALAVRRHLPHLIPDRRAGMTALCVVVAYSPVIRTMWGGQNTPLTLGLLALAFGALRADRAVLAGVAVGMLSFKPQYGVLAGVALLLWRRWTAAGVAMAIGLAHYAVGAVVIGADWPLRMVDALRAHQPRELAATGPYQFSIPRVAHHVLPESLAGPVGWLGVAAVAVTLVALLRRSGPDRPGFVAAWGLLVAGTMLVSPHLVYYDAGLLVLPVLLGLDEVLRRRGDVPWPTRLAVVAAFFLFPAYKAVDVIGIQPLFFVLVVVFLWLARLVATDERR